MSAYEKAEQKASSLTKQVIALEQQLADAQEAAQEETRIKLLIQGKLRQAEEEAIATREQLENAEQVHRNYESRTGSMAAQVHYLIRFL